MALYECLLKPYVYNENTLKGIEERKKRVQCIFFDCILPDDITKFRNFLLSDKLHGREIMQSFTLEDPRYKEYLDLLIESGKYRNCTFLRIMQDQKVLNVIDHIGVEKFSIFIDRDGYEFEATASDVYWYDTSEGMQETSRVISQITVERLRAIFESNIARDQQTFSKLGYPNYLNVINSTDIKDLETIFNDKEFINDGDLSRFLCTTTELDKRRNLSFAVALYKKGVVSNITFDYLSNNNNALHNDVIGAFPKSFPIKRIIDAPTVPGLVPKLVDGCIRVVLNQS